MGKIRSTMLESQQVVYEVPAQADMALQNWARWSSPRHGLRRRTNPCFRLVKPDRWGDTDAHLDAPAPFAMAVDAEEAWAVEKIICSPLFWPPARTLLTEHYLHRADQRATCRLLGLHRDAYDHDLWRAACMFWNKFQQQQAA